MKFNVFKFPLPLILISTILLTFCDKDVSTSPPEPEPPKGFIYVDSNPRNYKIYLDGRFTGRFTPDTLPYVEEIEHIVELKRKYWLDSSAYSFAEPFKTKSVYIDFMLNPKIFGSFNFQSKPDSAIVSINDSLTTSTTPAVIDSILPGVYNIKYELFDHRSRTIKTIVESNKTTTVNLALQDTSIWVDFTEKNSELPNNIVNTVTVDNENRVWVGTAKGGIVTIKGSKWEFINTSNSAIPSDSIRVIEIDDFNRAWVGTKLGVAVIEKNNVQRIINTDNSPLLTNTINAIEFYGNDKVYIGTSAGLLFIDNGNMKLFPPEGVSAERDVTALEVEDDRHVWVGVSGTLGRFDGSGLIFETRDGTFFNSFPNVNISGLIIRPADGKLWALLSGDNEINRHIFPPTKGQKSYLTVWNGEKWLYQQIGDEGTVLTDVVADRDNYVWITSNIALTRYETIRIGKSYFPYNTGLTTTNLSSVIEDLNGTLWIGSSAGLFKYKKGSE